MVAHGPPSLGRPMDIPSRPGFPWRRLVTVAAILLAIPLFWVVMAFVPKETKPRQLPEVKTQRSTGRNFLEGKKTSAVGVPVEEPIPPEVNGTPAPVIQATAPVDGLDKDELIRQLREDNQRLNALRKQQSSQPPGVPRVTSNPKDDERAREAAERKKEDADARKTLDVWSAKIDEKKGTLHTMTTPYSLPPTTRIDCETEEPISNQVDGAFRAYVTRPVRAANGATVIPPTSKFLMRPAGKSVFGDEWLGVQADQLVFPDDSYVKLTKGTVGDQHGAAGFKDQIDRRIGTALLGSLAIGALKGGSSLVGGGYGGGYSGDASERVAGSVASETANQSTKQVQQFIRTDPIITIRGRHPCHFMLEEELTLTRAW
jgi:type IV secretory pathway VirB10-like protein